MGVDEHDFTNLVTGLRQSTKKIRSGIIDHEEPIDIRGPFRADIGRWLPRWRSGLGRQRGSGPRQNVERLVQRGCRCSRTSGVWVGMPNAATVRSPNFSGVGLGAEPE